MTAIEISLCVLAATSVVSAACSLWALIRQSERHWEDKGE